MTADLKAAREALVELLRPEKDTGSIKGFEQLCMLISVEHGPTILAAIDRLAHAQEDAERYRWLKTKKAFRNPETGVHWGFFSQPLLTGISLDAAIDAARREK